MAQKSAKTGQAGGGGAFHNPFSGLAKLKDEVPNKKPTLLEKAAARKSVITKEAPKDERDLFLEEMQGAVPLDRKIGRVGAPPPDPQARPKRASDDAEVLATLADLCDGRGTFDVTDSDEFIEGLADGIDRRLLRRLRAGDFAVQAHLDLHGLTREEARERVARFLTESKRAARRCVLIVHGRGNHSKDQIPVLKQAVKTWLERGQTSRQVLAYASARPSDGGTGAVYVLLRR